MYAQSGTGTVQQVLQLVRVLTADSTKHATCYLLLCPFLPLNGAVTLTNPNWFSSRGPVTLHSCCLAIALSCC